MKRNAYGFTIVELLIVIVVIGILAAITIVAYNGVQTRALDNSRTQAVAQIRKALEAYKAEHGIYPPHTAIMSNAPAGFSGRWGIGYSYSVDTAGGWLRNLTSKPSPGQPIGMASSVPVDPVNNNSYYLVYWSSTGYGACTSEPFYVLSVRYKDVRNVPEDSRTLICTGGGATAHWSTGSGWAVFSNISTPAVNL